MFAQPISLFFFFKAYPFSIRETLVAEEAL